jgi:hypothetical protein
MRQHFSRVAIAVLLVTIVAVPAAAAATPAPTRNAPKVVLIVGPVGQTTAEYRALADEAAGAAAEFTPNVVKVYSPDATWPAVRNALQGAAVVVYLGHGNGWPSPYRKALYPASQNGFGLNPVAGGGDDGHQYFGEDRIATEVRLAPNAIVILSRLCYASGNSEPGLPEGTPADAQQRVDNYAAGFIASGAGAVIAEAHAGPAWYVRQVLSGSGSIERLWRSAPTANDHVTQFESARSPGHIGLLDPDEKTAGFYRSMVLQPGLVTDLRQGRVSVVVPPPAQPTLLGLGLTLGAPSLTGQPTVGTRARLKLHYTIDAARSLPDGLRVGVRWDPLDPPEQDADAPTTPKTALVAGERLGSVVEPVKAIVGRMTIAIPVKIPDVRGRYRLVVTLHDARGDAYDRPSQEIVRQAIVRVTGAVDAAVKVQPAFTTVLSSPIELPVSVTNLGVAPWGRQTPVGLRRRTGESLQSASLVARWIPLDPSLPLLPFLQVLPPDGVAVRLPPGLEPLARADTNISAIAPGIPGKYLLMLDVVTPSEGSLAALGIEPTLVRVTITETPH